MIGFVAGAVVAAGAQAAKPQGAAPTVKDVLYSAADSIGMLRTAAEVDRIATMNYWATGTVVADGKPCKVKKYKASITVSVEGGKTILSFPVIEVSGATIRATYSQETYLLERVEARIGATTIDISYAEHGDWNGDDCLSDVQFPKRITQKRGNSTVLDLTVTKTNTYNPYVVMPVRLARKAKLAFQRAELSRRRFGRHPPCTRRGDSNSRCRRHTHEIRSRCDGCAIRTPVADARL